MQKTNTLNEQRFSVKTLTKIGVLSAISVILMLFEIPLWFAPGFYKLDFSEVAVLIGAFALGPVAGISIEFVKILLNFLTDGTTTGGIGELANFLIGCAMVVPAAIIYKKRKTLKSAIIGLIVGIFSMAIVGGLLNYFVLLPVYKSIMPLEAIMGMCQKVNPNIVDFKSLVILATTPFNLFKGVVVSVITLLLYKKLSKILHK